MSELAQQIVNGLAAGAIYALIAVGYNLVYGLLGLINFAHGHVYMVGTFVAFTLMQIGWPFPVAILGGLVIGALLGMAIERIAYRPLRSSNRIVPTVSAVAVSLVLENVATLIWGPQTRRFESPLPEGAVSVLGVRLSAMHGIVFGVAAVMALLLWVFVEKSSWGRNVRAIRDDLPTAQLVGISVNRTVSLVYAVGSILGVIAGVLFASYYSSVYVGMGFNGTLNAFTAAVIGGIGSIKGSFIGGLALGVVQALAVGFISSGYMNAVTFVVLILFLLVRPLGVAGKLEVSRA